ncbi:MAG: hypothetical protein ACRD2F_06385 [Terriglobales bacterium]
MGTIRDCSYDDYCRWAAELHNVTNWHAVRWNEADRERMVERILGYCGWDCASCRDADRACIRHHVALIQANGRPAGLGYADLLLCEHDPTVGLPRNNRFYQLGGHKVRAVIEVKDSRLRNGAPLRRCRSQVGQYYLHLSQEPWGSNGALWVVTNGLYWEWGDAPRPPDGELAVQDSGTIGDAAFRQRLHRRFTVDNLLAEGVRRARQGAS